MQVVHGVEILTGTSYGPIAGYIYFAVHSHATVKTYRVAFQHGEREIFEKADDDTWTSIKSLASHEDIVALLPSGWTWREFYIAIMFFQYGENTGYDKGYGRGYQRKSAEIQKAVNEIVKDGVKRGVLRGPQWAKT